MFIGDHTSPDDPGYLDIIRTVLDRFHPELKLRLISAGARGQTVTGVASQAFMDILTSSRPDYLVVGLGLADALREPVARQILENLQRGKSEQDAALEATFGPEHRPRTNSEGDQESGKKPELQLENVEQFTTNLRGVVQRLRQAGVGVVLMTPALVISEPDHPMNDLLGAYSKAMRKVAADEGTLLVDVQRAFHDLFDRAANYKQRAALTAPSGALNAQGQTLIARTFLAAFDLLPGPGYRPQG